MAVFFSTNLKHLRNLKNISQTSLAEALHINRNKIASYENNIAEPKLSLIPRIAKYFNVTITQLLYINLTENNDFVDNNNLYALLKLPEKHVVDEYIKNHYNALAVYKGLIAMHEFDPNFTTTEELYDRMKMVIEKMHRNNEKLINVIGPSTIKNGD